MHRYEVTQVTQLQDDFDRENEGDFIGAAETATAESVALMLRNCTGVVCVPLEKSKADALGLPLMVPNNEDPFRTAFTVTADYKVGTTTGISASDRASTVRALANPGANPKEFSRPGHIFPLISKEGGTLVRGGHTEASVDLCKLAGLEPVAYICEICDHHTFEMSRLPALVTLADSLHMPIISIADLRRYRLRKDVLVFACSSVQRLPFQGDIPRSLSPDTLSLGSASGISMIEDRSLVALSPAETEEAIVSAAFESYTYQFGSVFNNTRYAVSVYASKLGVSPEKPRIGTEELDVAAYVHYDDWLPIAGEPGSYVAERCRHYLRKHTQLAPTSAIPMGIFVCVYGNPCTNTMERQPQTQTLATLAGEDNGAISVAPPSAYSDMHVAPKCIRQVLESCAPAELALALRVGRSVSDRLRAELGQVCEASIRAAQAGCAAPVPVSYEATLATSSPVELTLVTPLLPATAMAMPVAQLWEYSKMQVSSIQLV
jgi:3,4-dihydroxy 2-butanone 4-phosphate synthase